MIHAQYTVFGAPCCHKMSQWFVEIGFDKLPGCFLAKSIVQADLLLLVGSISTKHESIVKLLTKQMLSPHKVIHFRGCRENMTAPDISLDLVIEDCLMTRADMSKSLSGGTDAVR